MSDYRKKYKTKSATAIGRIKELESSLTIADKYIENYKKTLDENAYLAKEASSLARKNVELEKDISRSITKYDSSVWCNIKQEERLKGTIEGLKTALSIVAGDKND